MKFLDRIFGKKINTEEVKQVPEEMTCEEVYNGMKKYADEESYYFNFSNVLGYSDEDIEYIKIMMECKIQCVCDEYGRYNVNFDKLISEGKKLKELLFQEPTKKLKLRYYGEPNVLKVFINGDAYSLKY